MFAGVTVQRRHVLRDKEIVTMGLKGADSDIIDRHLWVTRHAPEIPVDSNYVPVHIVFRKNQSDDWHLMGSGTLLTKFTNHFVSAYHVFAGQLGQLRIFLTLATILSKIVLSLFSASSVNKTACITEFLRGL